IPEVAVSDLDPAGAMEFPVRIETLLEKAERHRRLYCRSGWVESLRDLVEQRDMVVLRQHLPLGTPDALAEAVGIECRHRHISEHVAGRDLHGDERTRFRTHSARCIFL